MKIPMVDLNTNCRDIRQEIDAAIKIVIDKTNFILGDEVETFEKQFAAYCGVKYAIGVASGTDALKIALIAAGIKKGDEVITTPFTFVATAETIVQAGAKPVFADIEPDTYTIDPAEIKKKITKKTRAILPVHLYGHPANMDEIVDIAKKYSLDVIEDCAQSFSAKYKFTNRTPSPCPLPSRERIKVRGGKIAKSNLNNSDYMVTGSIGKAGCFSFFPAKNLGCFGDGGMITTNDETVFENAKMLRNHGSRKRYLTEVNGFNSRLDTIQAAILSIKLKYIEKWTDMRNSAAQKYNKALQGIVTVPKTAANCKHSFNYYTIRFKNKDLRNKVQEQLTQMGVATQIYYPLSLHLQPVYKELGYKKGDFPVSEKASDELLSLPMYPELKDEQIRYITDAVKNI